MTSNTTVSDVIRSFESLPQSKYVLPEELENQWFLDALGEYELEIHTLDYNNENQAFNLKLEQYQIKTLALIMYTYYLTRELSRAEKLGSINTKDITITGGDESKRTILNDLKLQMDKVSNLINKQKTNCFS